MLPIVRRLLTAIAALPALAGCIDAYCQSGSRYGTQCYSASEVERAQAHGPVNPGENPVRLPPVRGGSATSAPPPPSGAAPFGSPYWHPTPPTSASGSASAPAAAPAPPR